MGYIYAKGDETFKVFGFLFLHFCLDSLDLILIYSQTSLHFQRQYKKSLGGYLLAKWSKEGPA